MNETCCKQSINLKFRNYHLWNINEIYQKLEHKC